MKKFLPKTINCILVLLALTADHIAYAEEAARLKVGLALSGGGGRGAAHIGVLKKLEELNVPVDYIAGTSIGSIIGGMYASGYSSREIEVLMAKIDWTSAFSDKTDRAPLPMRRKLDETDFLIDFEVGVDANGISVPKGVLYGQNLRLILNDIFRGVMLTDDFDQLPIPFRAVASDIENGTPVTLNEGSIVNAVQASMAVPGVFAPVEIGGIMLVDGGVTNNLPVDVVRNMGADIVIAVDVSTPLISRKNLRSAINILDQLTNILNQTNVQDRVESLSEQDILIRPRLGGISTADFSSVEIAVEQGEKSMQPYAAALSKLALNPNEYVAYREKISTQHQRSNIIPADYISVRQDSKLSSAALRSRLRITPASVINQKLLHKDIGRLYGLGIFQTVDYRLQEDNGLVGLVIDAKEKDWGPNYLKFGFQLEDDFAGGSDYNLLVGLNRKPINSLGGELSGVVKAGGEPKLGAEIFQPFNSLAETYGLVSLVSGQSTINYEIDGSQLASYRIRETEAKAYLGAQYSNFIDARLGIKRSVGSSTLTVGDDKTFDKEVSFDGGSIVLEFNHDNLDTRTFPSSGHRSSFEYERHYKSLGSDYAYTQFKLDGISVKSVGEYRFGLNYRFDVTLEGEARIEALSRLGGFQNLSGYSKNEFSGQSAGLLGLMVYRPVLEDYFDQFQHPLYVGTSVEAGNVWQAKSDISVDNLRYSFSVFMGTETPLGPIYIGFGQAEENQSSLHFSLGHLF